MDSKETSAGIFDRLLRKKATPKEYVDALRAEARTRHGSNALLNELRQRAFRAGYLSALDDIERTGLHPRSRDARDAPQGRG